MFVYHGKSIDLTLASYSKKKQLLLYARVLHDGSIIRSKFVVGGLLDHFGVAAT